MGEIVRNEPGDRTLKTGRIGLCGLYAGVRVCLMDLLEGKEEQSRVQPLLSVKSGAQTNLARCWEPPNSIEIKVDPCKRLEKGLVCRKG